jgi:hypothetical protein
MAEGSGVSVECTPMMKARERPVWLTDHPGATVEYFDRERRLFNSVHGGQQRFEFQDCD